MDYHRTPNFHKGATCLSHKSSSYWSSASNMLTSSSVVSIMNRSMVQLWVLPSAPSLPTCSWKSLRLKPLAFPLMPNLWLRLVGDTFVIQKAEQSHQFLHNINTQHPNIQFTVEKPDQDGSLPFLDTKVTPGPNSTLNTTAHRNPTHTDQYLQWDSNHFITAKHSVYNTLAHRAKVVSIKQALNKELKHIRKALHCCHFPTWALKLHQNFQHRHCNNNEPTPPPTTTMGKTTTTTTGTF